MKKRALVFGTWIFLLVAWIVYSYTQVDLNLTLSSNRLYQVLQQQLLQFGYYNRPAATLVLTILLLATFGFWFWVLHLIALGKLHQREVWQLLGLSAILILAYPGFSHDLFNYMFDARVVTKYGLDPRYFRALDFPTDTWTRFMHWTHRYYPYGPGWLYLSLIPSFLGLGKFTLTLLCFKLMFFLLHISDSWLIAKILAKLNKGKALLAVAFYALNPLVIVEGLVSPHNELAMVTFLLLAIYLLMQPKNALGIVSLLISASIKYVSIILLPFFLFWKKLDEKLYLFSWWLWLLALIPLVVARQAYSWYVLPLVALGALVLRNRLTFAATVGLSGLLFQYLPFSYFGDYSSTTNSLTLWITAGSAAILFLMGYFSFNRLTPSS